MKYAVGIDLGGTRIKALAVNEHGEVLLKCSRDTGDAEPGAASPKNTNPSWAITIKELLNVFHNELDQTPAFIGLCAPGLASHDGRSIAFMPGRLSGLEGFNWSEHLGQDVFVVDDAKAALLGELWQGAASGYRNVIMLTLGTGVGGAIYCDGNLLKGHIGRAGNLGHLCLDVDGTGDVAGMPGSLENAIGECTVKSRSNNQYQSTKELVESATNGDPEAKKIWERSVYKLACGIASLINIIDPEIVLIGGGISKAKEALFIPLNAYLDQLEWRPAGKKTALVAAELGEWAGAFGAAYNAIKEATRNEASHFQRL